MIILKEISEMFRWFIFAFPGKSGQFFRVLWAKLFFARFARGARLSSHTKIYGANFIVFDDYVSMDEYGFLSAHQANIHIGTQTKINRNVMINASDGGHIEIGQNCLIGPNVVVRSANHVYVDRSSPINQQGHIGKTIIIEDDVWIGANVTITAGVTIKKGSVIAAGAVVTKSFDEYSIIAGLPAKKIGSR